MNIMRTVALTKESTKDILENLLKRSPNNYGKFEAAVDEILNKVKTEGDAALFAYTKEFDKTEISADTIKVTEEEIKEAYEAVDPALIDVIRKALVNIRSYHEKQRQNSWFTSETNGTMLGQKVTALERVGVYVPGGKAVYPSSVLMNIVPAKVAGVDQLLREKTVKSIHPLWLQPKKPVQMKFTKSAEHRQSVHLLTVQKASQKLTKL